MFVVHEVLPSLEFKRTALILVVTRFTPTIPVDNVRRGIVRLGRVPAI